MIAKNESFIDELIHELVVTRFSKLESNLVTLDETHDIFYKVREIFKDLTAEQQNQFLFFLRGISIETIALILGVIDGVSCPDELNLTFELEYEGSEIQGDLEDVFLGKVQDMGLY